eukprot:gene16671-5116_t
MDECLTVMEVDDLFSQFDTMVNCFNFTPELPIDGIPRVYFKKIQKAGKKNHMARHARQFFVQVVKQPELLDELNEDENPKKAFSGEWRVQQSIAIENKAPGVVDVDLDDESEDETSSESSSHQAVKFDLNTKNMKAVS